VALRAGGGAVHSIKIGSDLFDRLVRAREPLINTVWPSGPHRGIAQTWLGENVAPGSGLAVAASAALAGAVVALDPQAVQSWG